MATHTLKIPTLETMRGVATELGFGNMGGDDLRPYLKTLKGDFAGCNVVDGMPDEVPEVRFPRTPGRRPPPEENPRRVRYVKTKAELSLSGRA